MYETTVFRQRATSSLDCCTWQKRNKVTPPSPSGGNFQCEGQGRGTQRVRLGGFVGQLVGIDELEFMENEFQKSTWKYPGIFIRIKISD